MRRKRAVIGSILVMFALVAAIVAEALISGRFNLPTIQKEQTVTESSKEDKVIIIEREKPVPTPSPTPTPAPTLSPQAEPPKTENQAGHLDSYTAPAKQAPPAAQAQPTAPAAAEPTVPVVTPPPYKRPEVVETPAAPPAPEPEPEITSISLDTYDMSLLAGDSWRLSILSAPASVTSQGAKWVTSNSAVLDLGSPDLSGVTIQAKAAGAATVTIYSRDGQYSASCTVTVSQ